MYPTADDMPSLSADQRTLVATLMGPRKVSRDCTAQLLLRPGLILILLPVLIDRPVLEGTP